MQYRSFLNVPIEIAKQIIAKEECHTNCCFRALYQKGNPKETDFFPTFVDENQKRIWEHRESCGGMAKCIVSKRKELKPDDYSVSLIKTIEEAKKKFWKNDSYKKDHPAIACGFTDPLKGYPTNGNNLHISYFLYDYIQNNPYVDFVTVEEATIDE